MKLKYTGLLLVVAGMLLGSCKKNTTVFNDPYAGGKPALGISVNPQQIPLPAEGEAGTEVTIAATGLSDYYAKKQLKFLFNGQEAQIVNVTATNIIVKVPGNASSGVTSFVVDGQLVFGPVFTVLGKVAIDPTFVAVSGADGAVLRAFPVPLTQNLILLGAFTNYDGKGSVSRQNRIVRIFPDGTWDRSLLAGGGANSTLWDMAQVGPYYYVVGDLTGYAQQGSGISRITRLNVAGQVDTAQVLTYTKKTKFIPAFNGGTTGTIRDIYPVGTNKMIISGNFNYYVSRQYDRYTFDYKDSTVTDSVDVRQLARLNEDGSLDRTWRFLPTELGYRGQLGKSKPGANGPIRTIKHTGGVSGKILVYGTFTSFDGTPAGGIIRLNAEDGSIDPSFNVGAGFDQGVAFVSFDEVNKKYLAAGVFNTVGGKASQYLVRLNLDGSVDATFTPKVFIGGIPTYAKALTDGLIVVGGNFRTYNNVIRNGFAILNPDGTLADGYNTVGNLTGEIIDTYETKTADNKRALLIMGSFFNFNNKIRRNLIRVKLEI
ncbi:DUF5008 domain-containing protein [Mucilaginibacter antarcticus]|uniref:DUF5008 domain-containing protein n=1 Tax=Mucilaginibacter antarcticus TaxID=1855725 RepID=A0ABW5XQ17_9SPHI